MIRAFFFKILIPVVVSMVNIAAIRAEYKNTLADQPPRDVGQISQILKSGQKSQQIGQAIRSDQFYRSKDKVINLGISKDIYWIKFKIPPLVSDHSFIMIEQSRLAYPECYILSKDSVVSKLATYAIKDLRGRKWPGTGYIAELPAGTKYNSYEVYLKLKSEELLVTTIKVGSKDSFNSGLTTQELIFGLYSGVMFVMLIYNFFLFLSVRDKSYIYYVCYILSIWLTQISISGFASKYLWSSNEWLNNNAVSVFSNLTGIMAFIFIKVFLNIPHKRKPLSTFLYFNIFTFSVSLLLTLFGFRQVGFILMQLSTFIGSLFALYIATIVYKSGFAPAKYFLTAWSLLLVGACLFIMKDYNIIPYNNFSIYILQIASATEVTLLSFALADKINIFKKEKEISQAEALRVLTENEKLVREQNTVLEIKVKERTEALENANLTLNTALVDLKEAQSQLVNSEKMAGLGQLTAGIAHEINNPINFVTSNIKPLELDINDLDAVINLYEDLDFSKNIEPQVAEINAFKKQIDLPFVRDEIKSLLAGIGEGAKRTAEIIRSLKNFSRLDENDTKPVDIAEGLDSSLVLIKSTFPSNLKIIKDYKPIPEVECMPGKINQVFMNLLTNAIHAIKAKEIQNEEEFILLKIWQEDNFAKISIRDSGTGMPEAVKQKIFEPFFTTKDVGEGTGLGLSIAFRIIESHNGSIDVITNLGEGTEFIINLPINTK
ncbi:sensor histidine kinase [Pedobacter ginsengisoli]|uniref:sensor histidine kinase n=1 Tax=Pedobacter ginsengisoli TaxID=363852 RepID=UPI00254C2305|nr:7TM diverse intracellular signaling domain-containing protein [Pedobacter ginsengisoli]